MKIVHVLLLCLYATHIACQQPTVSVVGAGIGGAGIYQFSYCDTNKKLNLNNYSYHLLFKEIL